MDRFYTVEEVAERFRTSPAAIHTQRHRGVNPGALGIKILKRILWRESDLEEWIHEQAAEQHNVGAAS